MATPVKSVQFRDADSIVQNYRNMEIPAFGIKQSGALNFKYQGNSMVDGAAQLSAYLGLLDDNESAAIYTLCLYEEPDGRITEKTPVDLSWNFRLRDQVSGFMPAEMYGGGFGQMIGEIRKLQKEWEDFKKKPAAEQNKLGVIGEVMEMEAFQPILMAIGTRIADLVMPATKVGELKRVSGIRDTSDEPAAPPIPWQEDPRVPEAIQRLSKKEPDIGGLLCHLAEFAETKPTMFNMYVKIFRRT
jgi:hypothetical protein